MLNYSGWANRFNKRASKVMKLYGKKSENRIVFSGNVVKDAETFNGAKGNVTKFTIAHNKGKEQPALFVDVVILESAKRPSSIDKGLLKKGASITVEGYLDNNRRAGADGKTYDNWQICAYKAYATPNVEVEVSEDGKTATVIDPANSDEDMPEA